MSKGTLVEPGPAEKADALDALRDYEAAILYLDDQVGRLLADLERRGRLDNTLVIITSDHGEEFGAHGQRWHGRTVYLPSIHGPLVVRLPNGARAGARETRTVSLTGLSASTVTALGLGVGEPFPGGSFHHIDGAGGATVVHGPAIADVVLDERITGREGGWFRSIVDDEMHYIASDTGREELYRFRMDPFEQNDLAAADSTRLAAYRALLHRLRNTPD
jgi:arylsulfatase A-like enzyme